MLTGAVIGFVVWFMLLVFGYYVTYYTTNPVLRPYLKYDIPSTAFKMVIFILVGASIGYFVL